MKLLAGAKYLAEKTVEAYSADRYANWEGVARALLRRGYSDRQAEAIMCSKWARWGADQYMNRGGKTSRYGKIPAKACVEFADKQSKEDVARLTEEHFGDC